MATVPPTNPTLPAQPVNSATAKPNLSVPNQGIATSKINPVPATDANNLAPLFSDAAKTLYSADALFSIEKVNAIKQAIAEGKFQVDAEKVAEKLIDDVHDFLNTKK